MGIRVSWHSLKETPKHRMNKYYKNQFNKVLEYIHLNLDGELDIKTLAKVAFISEFHFHRLMKSFLGEALGIY